MPSDDTEYFRQRAVVERALAKKAVNPDVAAVHEALAQRYVKLAASLDMGEESRWQGFLQNRCR
jgi:hypothetical protein